MPNHIKNVIRSDKLDKIRELMVKENQFDFNAVIPMPKDLEGTRSPVKIVSQEEYNKQTDVSFDKSITKEMQEKFLREYGDDNWYDWSIKNWGTKWNAYEFIDNGDSLEFETAWSTPEPVIKALSKAIKGEIQVDYADEDIGGGNCGTYAYNDGLIILDTQGDEKFALALWGLKDNEESND